MVEIAATVDVLSAFDGFNGTRSVVVESDSGIGFTWSPKESIGVYGSGSLKNSEFTSTNKYSNTSSPVFSGWALFSRPTHAYYPYSAEAGSNSSAVNATLPQTQTYNTTSKFMTTDFKIGTYSSRTLTGYKFTFSSILTYLRFRVNATGTALEGDELKSVSITVTSASGEPRQLWGDFTMDLTQSAESAITSWAAAGENSNTLTLSWPNALTMPSGTTITGYCSVAPNVEVGDQITFTILTDKRKATFTRTSKMAFAVNGLVNYPLTLSNFTDMVVENFVDDPVTPEEPETPEVAVEDCILSSLKFTVENNPGKILARSFTHDSNYGLTVKTHTEQACVIDEEAMTITLNLPYFNSRKLIPTFEIPEGTALVTDLGLVEEGVEIDFSQVKQIGVLSLSEMDGRIYDVKFENTGLPVVVVNQNTDGMVTSESGDYAKASEYWYNATATAWLPKDADWPSYSEDGSEVATNNFMIYNYDGTSALINKGYEVVESPVLSATRVRGNVTQQMPKKPFAVKLDKKHGVKITKPDGSQFEMAPHKRWVLLANWKDRTMMRNEVAFGIADVFKQTFPNDGIAWNPSGTFVELVYNGVHVGTYYLCEQVKIDENRLDINKPYDKEDAYSGTAADYGYLLESDDGFDETWQFVTKTYVPFLFKDDCNDDMLTYAQTFVRGVEEQLYAGNYTTAYEKMDTSSFADFLLIQELMMNSEMKHPKSCYHYINNDKMYAGPIWDFDWNTLPVSTSYSEEGYSYTSSMLNKAKCYYKSSGYPTGPYEESSWISKTYDANYIWYPMLVKNANFKTLLADRWTNVKDALLGYVTSLDVTQTYLKDSWETNATMWPLDTKNSPYRGAKFGIGWTGFSENTSGAGFCGDEGMEYDAAFDKLQTTLNNRIDGMTQYIVTNPTWPSITYTKK